MPQHQHVEFELVTQRAQFDALETCWNALFDQAALPHNIFQGFNWNWHWCNAYLNTNKSKNTGLSVVVGRQMGVVTVIIPLVAERRLGIKWIRWMGDPVSQYGDALIADFENRAEILRSGLAFVKTKTSADLIYLKRVRSDSSIAAALNGSKVSCVETNIARFVPLDSFQNSDEFIKGLSKKRRKSCGRLFRRLEERGTVQVEFFSEGPSASQAMKDALVLKRRWLQDTKRLSLAYSDPCFDAFLMAIAGSTQNPIGVCMTKMTCADETVAIEFGIVQKGHYVAHIGAINLDWAQFSPGKLQMLKTIGHCIGNNNDTYDLMAPDDPYKREWAKGEIPVKDYVCEPSLIGSVYIQVLLRWGKPVVKTIFDTYTKIRR